MEHRGANCVVDYWQNNWRIVFNKRADDDGWGRTYVRRCPFLSQPHRYTNPMGARIDRTRRPLRGHHEKSTNQRNQPDHLA